jgi:hypothetical protein
MEKGITQVYKDFGYTDRKGYLTYLADEMGIDKYIVFTLADLLGASEDFDGLVSSLQDYENHESLALLGL